MDNFFATTTDDASVQAGQLHSYLLPSLQTKTALAAYLAPLGQFDYLAPQPREALHLTVTRFKQASTDSLPAAIEQLTSAAEITALPALRGTWQAPICENSSVIMRCTLPGFAQLCEASERAAKRVLGADAVCYPRPYTSHLTLAYGVSSGPDDPVLESLENVKAGLAEDVSADELFTSLAWCMVKQNPLAGTYTFQVLGVTEFAC